MTKWVSVDVEKERRVVCGQSWMEWDIYEA